LQVFSKGIVVRIRFGPFVLNLDTRQLFRDHEAVHLTPKAFELLTTLALERPKALAKSVLLERLWPQTYVAEANISNLVSEIRAALDESPRSAKWIRTAHGFGYAFCGEVTAFDESGWRTTDRPSCWLEWGTKRFPLSIGEHVVGRDPGVDVRLDAPTVSRRHARVVVTTDGILPEDFGSKNGTLRGTDRVTSPVQLADGDAIHIGSLRLTFHVRTRATTTDTQPGVPA
jgi:DNA-binding winged helix-turn-helix (wHTH) protein